MRVCEAPCRAALRRKLPDEALQTLNTNEAIKTRSYPTALLKVFADGIWSPRARAPWAAFGPHSAINSVINPIY